MLSLRSLHACISCFLPQSEWRDLVDADGRKRTVEAVKEAYEEIESTVGKGKKEDVAKKYGIKGDNIVGRFSLSSSRILR